MKLKRRLNGYFSEYKQINPTNLSVAIDVIVIRQLNGDLKGTPFFVRFGKLASFKPLGKHVNIYVNNVHVPDVAMRLDKNGEAHFVYKHSYSQGSSRLEMDESALNIDGYHSMSSGESFSSGHTSSTSSGKKSMRSLLMKKYLKRKATSSSLSSSTYSETNDSVFTDQSSSSSSSSYYNSAKFEERTSFRTMSSENLKKLNLIPGQNKLKFTINTKKGTHKIKANLFLWDQRDKIVVTDIDGTITESCVKGQVLSVLGYDCFHNNIIDLYSSIANNGYKIVYLTARPFFQCGLTRHIIGSIEQNEKKMPKGPVMVNPVDFLQAFKAEFVTKTADEFKINFLEQIKSFFTHDSHPFHAGFGDKQTDIKSYTKIGIDQTRIFFVNSGGFLNHDPKQKGEHNPLTFKKLHDNLTHYFPPIKAG